jgi:hypothetical protein
MQLNTHCPCVLSWRVQLQIYPTLLYVKFNTDPTDSSSWSLKCSEMSRRCHFFFGVSYIHPWAGIAQSVQLWAGRSGDRIPVETRFSAPVQNDSGAHSDPCTIGTGYFPGVKLPVAELATPPPSSVEANERVQLYRYSPLDLRPV